METQVKRYSDERKEAVLKQMLPPLNVPARELARQTGISAWTLNQWRKRLKAGGVPESGPGQPNRKWTSADKFAVVLETAAMNEAELSEYCRKKGLLVEQVRSWKQACLEANARSVDQARRDREQVRADQKRIRELERDLRRKDRALAETTALLVLRKKADAIWGEPEGE